MEPSHGIGPRPPNKLRRSLRTAWIVLLLGWQPLLPVVAQTLADTIIFANRDINAMWARKFRIFQGDWIPPRSYIYNGAIQTPCGVMRSGNAQYCPRNHSIYLNQTFVSRVNQRVGDFAAVTVLAHEYGHAVQHLLGLSQFNDYPVQDELQADCLAGVYAQDAMSRGLLDASDIPEATTQSYLSGDPIFHPDSHGTPRQRVSAFRLGYLKGLQSCFRYSNSSR
ncbi:MAG: neutral zinc metallopeptidase [Thermosynechococcaceae cyanobacterium]